MEQIITWKSPKILAVVGVSLLLLFGLLLASNYVRSPVDFPDANLERVIREKINKRSGDIYRNELMEVLELDASGRDIQNLEGMQALRRLVALNLADNKIDDLRPLSRLGMLRELDLTNNRVVYLQAAGFDELSELSLRDLRLRNNISSDGVGLSDVSLLSGMTDLERLDLRNNRIEDIEPLVGLSKLTQLDLRNNQIRKIEPLAELKELRELNLRDNAITDIRPLQGLTNLTDLNIHSNPVEVGVLVLGELENLQTLIMRNVYIGDAYSIFENLTLLQQLNIRNSEITDVSVIGELMARGALQDVPETGATAVIDILEIDPDGNGEDPYLSLRRYWDNISLRYPMSLPYYPSPVRPPVFSHQAGFYEQEFLLILTTDEPGGRIFYTLDGSEPALTPDLEPMEGTQEYIEPILIRDRTSEQNRLANIQTGTIFNYLPPDEILKLQVIRVISLDRHGLRSNLVSNSYFLRKNVNELFKLPILSIATNTEYLFDENSGIYVPGELYQNLYPERPWWNPANFTQRGLKWERPVSLQFFNNKGNEYFSQNVGLRVHGGATRSHNQKSLRLYADRRYDQNEFIDFDFFPSLNNRYETSDYPLFKSLILRNGGNDWRGTMFRDAMSQSLLIDTNLDIQGSFPVNLFINGEYWGIQNVRTRYDAQYFRTNYGIDETELVLLEGGYGSLILGENGDELNYLNILSFIDQNYRENNFVTVNTLKNDDNYIFLKNNIDIENFIDYSVSQIYFNNTDWGGQNIRLWRKKIDPELSEDTPYGHDGKWRWMVIDTDFGFTDPENNTLQYATRNNSISTYLLRSLLVNDTFKIKFINAFADFLNTIFVEENVVTQIDQFETLYYPDIKFQIQRWGNVGGSNESWKNNIEELRSFAKLRPNFIREQILDYFGLSGYLEFSLNFDQSKGDVFINSIYVNDYINAGDSDVTWSGIYFIGIPIDLEVIPKPGYEFVGWSEIDDLNFDSIESNISFAFEGDINLIAVFSEK